MYTPLKFLKWFGGFLLGLLLGTIMVICLFLAGWFMNV